VAGSPAAFLLRISITTIIEKRNNASPRYNNHVSVNFASLKKKNIGMQAMNAGIKLYLKYESNIAGCLNMLYLFVVWQQQKNHSRFITVAI